MWRWSVMSSERWQEISKEGGHCSGCSWFPVLFSFTGPVQAFPQLLWYWCFKAHSFPSFQRIAFGRTRSYLAWLVSSRWAQNRGALHPCLRGWSLTTAESTFLCLAPSLPSSASVTCTGSRSGCWAHLGRNPGKDGHWSTHQCCWNTL